MMCARLLIMKKRLLILALILCSAESNAPYKNPVEKVLWGASYMGFLIRDRGGSVVDLVAIFKAMNNGNTNAFEDWMKAH